MAGPDLSGLGVPLSNDDAADEVLPLIDKLERSDAAARRMGVSVDQVRSPAGALGRYQVMPSTGGALGYSEDDLLDPTKNRSAAHDVLAQLAGQFHQDPALMAAGYNGGPRRAIAIQNGTGGVPAETQDYYSRALSLLARGAGAVGDAVIPAAHADTGPDLSGMGEPVQAAPQGGEPDLSGLGDAVTQNAPAPAPRPVVAAPAPAAPANQPGHVPIFETAKDFVTSLFAGDHPLPNQAAPQEGWLDTMKKAVKNVPAGLERTAGGLIERLGQATPGDFKLSGGDPIADALANMQTPTPDPKAIDADNAKALATPGSLANTGRKIAVAAQKHLKENAPNIPDNSVKQYAYDVANGLPTMLGLMGASAATRSPLPLLGGFALQGYGDKYTEARQAGRTPEQADQDATFSSLATSLPATLPFHAVMKPGQKFLGKVLSNVGAAVAMNDLTAFFQGAYDKGVIDPNMTWGDVMERVAKATPSGIGFGLVMGGASGAAHRIRSMGDTYVAGARARNQQRRAGGDLGGEGPLGGGSGPDGPGAGPQGGAPREPIDITPDQATGLAPVHDPVTWTQTGWRNAAGEVLPMDAVEKAKAAQARGPAPAPKAETGPAETPSKSAENGQDLTKVDQNQTDSANLVQSVDQAFKARMKAANPGDARWENPPAEHSNTSKMVAQAIQTGTYNDAVHPSNKNARATFEEVTGQKLPATVSGTKAMFKGQPFPTAKITPPADSFTTSAGKVRAEHEAEVSALEAEGAAAAQPAAHKPTVPDAVANPPKAQRPVYMGGPRDLTDAVEPGTVQVAHNTSGKPLTASHKALLAKVLQHAPEGSHVIAGNVAFGKESVLVEEPNALEPIAQFSNDPAMHDRGYLPPTPENLASMSGTDANALSPAELAARKARQTPDADSPQGHAQRLADIFFAKDNNHAEANEAFHKTPGAYKNPKDAGTITPLGRQIQEAFAVEVKRRRAVIDKDGQAKGKVTTPPKGVPAYDFRKTFPEPQDAELRKAGRAGFYDESGDGTPDPVVLKSFHEEAEREMAANIAARDLANEALESGVDPKTGNPPKPDQVDAFNKKWIAQKTGAAEEFRDHLGSYQDYFGAEAADHFRDHLLETHDESGSMGAALGAERRGKGAAEEDEEHQPPYHMAELRIDKKRRGPEARIIVNRTDAGKFTGRYDYEVPGFSGGTGGGFKEHDTAEGAAQEARKHLAETANSVLVDKGSVVSQTHRKVAQKIKDFAEKHVLPPGGDKPTGGEPVEVGKDLVKFRKTISEGGTAVIGDVHFKIREHHSENIGGYEVHTHTPDDPYSSRTDGGNVGKPISRGDAIQRAVEGARRMMGLDEPDGDAGGITQAQARDALKTNIDPRTGKKPKGNKLLRDFRAEMQDIVSRETSAQDQKVRMKPVEPPEAQTEIEAVRRKRLAETPEEQDEAERTRTKTGEEVDEPTGDDLVQMEADRAEEDEADQAERSSKGDIVLADKITDFLDSSKDALDQKGLAGLADAAYGGTAGEGAYDPRRAYDAMELGFNRYIEKRGALFDPSVEQFGAEKAVARLRDLEKRLPIQSRRTGATDAFQQFSTPPHYAFAAAWLANIADRDVVLEPSAGNGGLAVFAKNAGDNVKAVVNELSEGRRENLKALDFDQVTAHDAEQINNLLPKGTTPNVVLMNPPFSNAAQRGGIKDSNVTGRHIEQALKTLAPGGRLVAITGHNFTEGNSKNRPYFTRWAKDHQIRASVGVAGKVFSRYGTSYPTRVIVIDKAPPDGRPTITGEAATPEALIEMLKEVRDDRPESQGSFQGVASTKQAPGEPGGETASGPGRGPGGAVSAATGGKGTGRPGAKAGGKAAPDGTGGSAEIGAAERGDALPDAGGRRGAGSAGQSEGSGDRGGSATGEPDGGSGEGLSADQSASNSLTYDSGKTQEAEELSGGVYATYRPQRLKIAGAKAHPAELVQSAAMASVAPPVPTYKPKLDPKVISEGKLSEAQLEPVVYAGQAHEKMLPDGVTRRGFFVGDGTGVGKGREISGVILDNFNQGRKKHVWVSEKWPLLDDAKRDWTGVGGDAKNIINGKKFKQVDQIEAPHGILFTTYDTLKGKPKKGTTGQTRVEQIVKWLGPDFDGVVAFDEAHNMANAGGKKGARGKVLPAEKALAGLELQKQLPNARIIYVSATGATEVSNLAYAERLGLWGPGTPFPTRDIFMAQIEEGGVAAMELVARDLKQTGSYLARGLSFNGVEYGRLEHKLGDEQRAMYDNLAEAWQMVLRNIDKALEVTGGAKDGRTSSAAYSAFWGSHQRFFNQVLTSMQMPTVLKQASEDIKNGMSPVFQLVNTNEAASERALARMEQDEGALEDLDLTPRDQLMQMVEHSFPVAAMETYVDENGNERSRPVMDGDGNVVQDKDAVAIRDKVLDDLASIRVPDGPLEYLLNHFGPDVLAEVTGRGRRVVERGGKRVVEKRPASANTAEAESFMSEKKLGLVFSQAGGTGRSYHADKGAKNQRRRSHYLLQPGWSAAPAIQGFGRTHRSNQTSKPYYRLATTDVVGQKRFISSIARRLDQLGALTKGERRSGGQGFFSEKDNLESQYAEDAVTRLVMDILTRKAAMQEAGLTPDVLTQQMGLRGVVDKTTGQINVSKIPDVTQFLNRLLSLKLDMQNKVFDAFDKLFDDNIAAAKAAGTLDAGVEQMKADHITAKQEQVVHTDPESGAETKYVALETKTKTQPAKWKDIEPYLKTEGAFLGRGENGRSYMFVPSRDKTNERGQVEPQMRRIGPLRQTMVPAWSARSKYEELEPEDAEKAWNDELAKVPEFDTKTEHMITGALLPIWDRLPKGFARVIRAKTDAGESYLGRTIPTKDLQQTLKNLGATGAKIEMEPAEVFKRVTENGDTITLANGWRLTRRTVSGEKRMRLAGPNLYGGEREAMERQGAQFERIGYEGMLFIPDNAKGREFLEKQIARTPIVSTGEDDAPDLSRAPVRQPQTETPEFKGWFGESKAVDKKGQPLRMYHGSPSEKAIAKFRTPAYFTPEPSFAEVFAGRGDKDGAIYPVYLRIENPYIINGETDGRHFEWDASDVRRMKREGHDGVWVKGGEDASDIWTAFDKEQIKSATGNNGDFDPMQDRIDMARAYHGTPHEFDKFDIDKVGTGEGNQTFGWGLYFAGQKKVAEHYRDALTRNKGDAPFVQGKDTYQFGTPEWEAASIITHDLGRGQTYGDRVQLATSDLQKGREGKGIWGDRDKDWLDRFEAVVERADDGDRPEPGRAGKTLRVNIKPEDSDFLSLDHTVAEQSPKVRAALDQVRQRLEEVGELDEYQDQKNADFEEWTGHEIVRQILPRMARDDILPHEDPEILKALEDGKDAKAASLYLKSLGVAGNKYLDAGSRREKPYADGEEVTDRLGKLAAEYIKLWNGRRGRIEIEAKDDRAIKAADRPAFMQRVDDLTGKKIEWKSDGTHNYVVFDHDHVDVEARLARAAGQQGDFPASPDARKVRIGHPDHGVELTFSPKYNAQRKALGDALRAALDRRGYSGIDIKIPDTIRAIDHGKDTGEALGTYWKNTIFVALDSGDKAMPVLDHELIHAIHKLGLIDEKDWQILAKKAPGWVKKYDLEKRYAASELDQERMIEEAVAHAGPDFVSGKLNEGNAVRRIFRKIQAFFEALRNALHGLGFRNTNDVFRDIYHDGFEHEAAGERAQDAPDLARRRPGDEEEGEGVTISGTPLPEGKGFLGRNLGRLDNFTGKAAYSFSKRLNSAASRIFPQSVKQAADAIQLAVTPMAAGSDAARATAKDFANQMRKARVLTGRQVEYLEKNFKPDQLAKMWEASDQESVLLQQGLKPGKDQGLNRLSKEERAAVKAFQDDSNELLRQAKDIGLFKGEGLPSYVPRMVVTIGADGSWGRMGRGGGPVPHGLDALGRNVKTTSPNLKFRKHLTKEETAEAAQGLDPSAMVVQDFRTLPLAMGRLQEAIAGRVLIDRIKAMGQGAGDLTVSEGVEPNTAAGAPGWFTIDHPAFKTYRPMLSKNAETGRWSVVTDANGNELFERVPLYIRKDFEGPLRAVLSQDSGQLYKAAMAIKGKTMAVIMYSPLMHNAVIWGKAFPAAPLRLMNPVWKGEDGKWHFSIEMYGKGRAAKNDPEVMKQALEDGLDPIGHRYFNQDISAIMEQPNIRPGRSWTAKALGYFPGLYDKGAGDAVRRRVDQAGDIWHNKLLWDLVGDLQMGMYQHMKESAVKLGHSEQTAGRYAAHFANRYAGALPIESMSRMARQTANLLLFSRSFTLTNLGAYKDLVNGLPKDVQAQIMRDEDLDRLNKIQGTARRKAASLLVLDIFLSIAGLALVQHAMAWMFHHAYHPPSQNEPDRDQRFLIGYQKDGTAIYGRLPIGKVGEELQDWVTEPNDITHRKLSPYAGAVNGIWTNDQGFGRKVYDPYDASAMGYVKNAGRIAKFLAAKIAPIGPFESGWDLYKGHGDPNTNWLKIALPMAGITISKGAPGGPAVGQLYASKDEHEFQIGEAMPGIRDAIARGDLAEAQKEMSALGMSKSYQKFIVRTTKNPGSRLSKKQVRDFMGYASPEEKARMRTYLHTGEGDEDGAPDDQHSALDPADLGGALKSGTLERFAQDNSWTRADAIRAASAAGFTATAGLLRDAKNPVRPELRDKVLGRTG